MATDDPGGLTAHARKNLAGWEARSDDYQQAHGGALDREPLAWGVWRVPEAELRVLGDVHGLDLLELGCGAAQWSIALVPLGARPVGLDLSARQLDHARRRQRAAGVQVPLVRASGERVPFADSSFDVVFCDHGAMSFADPERTVPEAARVLRPGGLLAFAAFSPWHEVCYDDEADRVGAVLRHDYFGLDRYEGDDEVVFNRTYGDWVRLFAANGLAVEDLIEPRPGPDATLTYRDAATRAWARRFPLEAIWKARRLGVR
ncbi:MAG TPA: class I SAM-dependent methyltransferase [Actinomycetes bacterium]|jgi:SAM-dependent methyltransferase|nr:class I SAM-dependent methyltransferase [Actinomycetes bacterium]